MFLHDSAYAFWQEHPRNDVLFSGHHVRGQLVLMCLIAGDVEPDRSLGQGGVL